MINIICVVPSLTDINERLYKNIKKLLGDEVTRPYSFRSCAVGSDNITIRFVSTKQRIESIAGLFIDILILADPEIPEEWMQFLKCRLVVNNGIMLELL